jgi:phosphatidylethanolamine N-methyltransferase
MKQSKRKWIVREVQRRAWLDGEKRPKMRAWIKSQLRGKMGADYSFDVSVWTLDFRGWAADSDLV